MKEVSNIKWTPVEERKPQRHDGFITPYISCLVYACNSISKESGIMDVCRWDVKNDCWFEPDIKSNWMLQPPYKITHFADDIKNPYK